LASIEKATSWSVEKMVTAEAVSYHAKSASGPQLTIIDFDNFGTSTGTQTMGKFQESMRTFRYIFTAVAKVPASKVGCEFFGINDNVIVKYWNTSSFLTLLI
jgi:hypothetical protein